MTLIYIVVAVTSLGFLAWWWFKGRKTEVKGEPVRKQEESTTLPIRALVFDCITGEYFPFTLNSEIVDAFIKRHETLGRQWEYYGEKLYAVSREMDGSFAHFSAPADFENPSSKLRRAITFPTIPETWGKRDKQSFFAKYGGVLLFAGLCFAGVFLYVVK